MIGHSRDFIVMKLCRHLDKWPAEASAKIVRLKTGFHSSEACFARSCFVCVGVISVGVHFTSSPKYDNWRTIFGACVHKHYNICSDISKSKFVLSIDSSRLP